MSTLVQLDGADGGGQILRTALSLSMITGRGFRIVNIRGKRRKSGLKRQHLTCVRAAVEISCGSADGAELDSKELVFQPSKVAGGDYSFAIGTAGSTTLLAQTLMPAFWFAKTASTLRLEGGTHNPMAPSAGFLDRVFLPQMSRMGAVAKAEVHRHGFAPAGGGVLEINVLPVEGGLSGLQSFDLLQSGEMTSRRIDCTLAHVPETVAEREIETILRKLECPRECVQVHWANESSGPGNLLEVEYAFEHVSERIASHGAHGVSSEQVARRAAKAMRNYVSSGVPVGLHLADQLLLPFALAGGGSFITLGMTNHIKTNIKTIEAFLPIRFAMKPLTTGVRIDLIG